MLTQHARWQENKSPLGINPPGSLGKRRRSVLPGCLRAITAIISFAIGRALRAAPAAPCCPA